MGKQINTRVKKIHKPRFFKPIGKKPQFETLFAQWRYEKNEGLPSKWLHPIKFHYYQQWNLMTHLTPKDGVRVNEVRKDEFYGSSRKIPPNAVSRWIDTGKPKKVTKKELAGVLGDSRLFL